jgi:hypothetical protein
VFHFSLQFCGSHGGEDKEDDVLKCHAVWSPEDGKIYISETFLSLYK